MQVEELPTASSNAVARLWCGVIVGSSANVEHKQYRKRGLSDDNAIFPHAYIISPFSYATMRWDNALTSWLGCRRRIQHDREYGSRVPRPAMRVVHLQYDVHLSFCIVLRSPQERHRASRSKNSTPVLLQNRKRRADLCCVKDGCFASMP